MDHSLTRGAAAALAFGALVAAAPVGAQAGGAIQVRPSQRDSFVVRIIDGSLKAKIDSMMGIMRALEDEPATSEAGIRLRRQLETMSRALSLSRIGGVAAGGIMSFRGGDEIRLVEQQRLKGWIGINPGLVPYDKFVDSTGFFIHYYRYPLIVSVEPDSPAQRAGIAPGDVLMAYDGQDVVKGRVNIGQLLIPERKLAVTVRREGEVKDYSLVVAKTPERIEYRRAEPGEFPVPPEMRGGKIARGMGDAPRPPRPAEGSVRVEVGPGGFGGGHGGSFNRMVFIERNGIFGAGLVSVGPELAKVFNIEKGVLIQDCPEETPAFKAGLRIGDVVVSVAGQPVFNAMDVQKMVMSRVTERAVTFQVVRKKEPMAVNVKW